jgi:PAS domain S-box-containing protein
MIENRKIVTMIPQKRYRNIPFLLVITFILLSAGILISGYFYYENQKKYIKKHEQESLAAIADLKVGQITNWRKERLGDAKIILGNRLIIPFIREFLNRPSETGKKEILDWLKVFEQYTFYKNIILLGADRNIRLSIADRKEIIGPDARMLAEKAMQTKNVVFSDLYRSKTTGVIRLTLAIPLLDSRGSETFPIGAILLRVDPYRFLYPLIQTWPTPGQTAETILVRREGDEVVFLNELRHKKNTALNLKFPVSAEKLPAAMVARNMTGVVEGNDYRGVPVIAAIRTIPDSPWFLVSKIDEEEIYAPVRERLQVVMIVMVLLIAGSGIGVGLLWRGHNAKFYRKQYETELAARVLAERYEYLTKHANDIILLLDGAGKILEANERAVLSYGYSGEELLQMSLNQIRAPERRSVIVPQIKMAEEQNGLVFETLHQRKGGTTFPVEVSSRVIEVEGRKYIQNIIRDITDRKKAEARLLEENNFSDSTINSLPGVFYVFDENGRYLRWNRNTETVTGYSDGELSKMGPLDFFSVEEKEMIAKVIQQVAEEGEAAVEANLVTKHGDRIPYFFTGKRFVSGDRKYLVGMGIDISERKTAEAEVRRLNDELEQRVRERTRQLEAANKELEAFSYSVSHDLRAPLRSINGFSEALLEDYYEKLDDEGRDYLRRVSAASQHMAQLIDDLLNLSRVTRYQMRKEEVDLSGLAKKIAVELRAAEPGRQAEFVITSGLVVRGDMHLLEILLRNLLENAFKFTGKQSYSKIEFDVIQFDAGRAFFVRDNGAGFDMAYKDKLYGAFHRLHTQAEFQGTGIGLAIVKRIVHRHGGNVWAEGKVGEGATFYFTLP